MAKTTPSPETTSNYRIGTVSKLTGISPDTLRVWERRYAAVVPQRTSAGGRLYSNEDIARLKLMKRLVDAGDSIGVIAMLGQDELQARVSESHETIGISESVSGPFRVAVIGEPLAARMETVIDELAQLDLVASYRNPETFMANTDVIQADVLVIEQPTLQPETAQRVVDWITRLNASHAIIVFRFAAQETLRQLPRSRCSTLRAPIDPQTLQHQIISLLQHQPNSRGEAGNAAGEPAPPRRYDDGTLARLASLSPTIYCECPRHLAELITSLCAFEQYSGECESRNLKDAELHAYLNNTASSARHLIETALDRVIETENIKI